jgi:CheY-like chemotaxis protein
MNSPEPSASPDRTILVVDDNACIREALRDLLELEGYRVAEAENGRVALDRLSELPVPSLIILDLIMPVMTGSEFLWAARSGGESAHVPILVFSALPGASWAARQADRALRKPIDIDVLLSTVAELCR